MSSAKRTPRYVERLQPPHIQIVGPSTEAREAQVIPIRRITPAYTPVVERPAAPPVSPAPRTRVSRVPVARRPWRVLLIPATPGAATRTFSVARWQARLVVGVVLVMTLLSGLAIGATVVALESPDLLATSADAATLREQLLDVEDSLSAAREDLAASEGARDSIIAMLSSAPAVKPPVVAGKPFARVAARKAAPRAAPRVRAEDLIASAPPSLEGLPVIGRLASGFSRSRRHPILHIRRPHLGIDIAAPRGTRINAPADGRVSYVGRRFGYGIVIEITHTNFVTTRYAHLRRVLVEEGDQVTRGMQIATVGSTGISTGPHLHYEVLVNGRQVDPLRFRLPQTTAATPPTATTPTSTPSAGSASSPEANGAGGTGGPATSDPTRDGHDSAAAELTARTSH